jgi:hypothetical protein
MPLFAKIITLVMLALIVGSLFSALFFMYRDRGSGERTARALTIRVGLSITLFLLLMAGYYFGIIPGKQ